jgi:preprotein translocase subunit SecE
MMLEKVNRFLTYTIIVLVVVALFLEALLIIYGGYSCTR